MFSKPQLTTIRQPLQQMGQIAAKTLIDQIERKAEFQPEIVIEPELVIRASTGPAPNASSRGIKRPLGSSVINGDKRMGPGLANSRRQQDR
jgi:Periplasmic binding protein-like domain